MPRVNLKVPKIQPHKSTLRAPGMTPTLRAIQKGAMYTTSMFSILEAFRLRYPLINRSLPRLYNALEDKGTNIL